jgi:hypothetical protein
MDGCAITRPVAGMETSMSENKTNGENSGGPPVEHSTIRSESKSFGAASLEIEESNMGMAQVRISGDSALLHVVVDLTRDDAEALRDELDELLEDE